MNQRHLWTIVALFMTVLGIPSVGCTQTTRGNALASQKSSITPITDAVKVGEYQSTAGKQTLDAVITEIHPHNVGGRKAATLFIRNIPVLTFLSSVSNTNLESKKVGEVGNTGGVQLYALIANNSSKAVSAENAMAVSNQISSVDDDPVQIAGIIAAKINQLNRENVDGSKITVSWKAGEKSTVANHAQNKSAPVQKNGDRYVIKINGEELVEINEGTRLAGTTNNLAQDALQATNRLRRLLGNASPLKEIANLPISIPKLPQEISVGGVRISFRGMASYYGYDGSGNRTASGQRFNPEEMTAAHRSLPFGTQVRVTNTNNGRSVVVRINDRGPFIRGRVIDLSAGAARILGMMGSGVAPVHIEVLGK
ncbi:septal ring lytic transglycosylase RlpA family protein [Nostoc sp.]|uniref:septal ring lytic transglycosylase RlpA family protein n=1 Tax=Nostoc sp. TaxID=1180 RepID=UPI002FF60E81